MASNAERLCWMSMLFAVVQWAICAAALPAQTAATPDAVIEEMAGAAGVIFAGQVTAVRRPEGPGAEGVVEVEFRVDQAVKGPAAGSVYTLREWAGLWNVTGGGGRYRVGQRLLVFLYAPDANGFSSPVRGLDGAVPLRGGGAAPGPDDSAPANAQAPANPQWLVDLRWVQAQALKTYPQASAPVGGGPVFPRPISPRPILPQPVHPLFLASRPMDGLETESARDGLVGLDPQPVRRLPVSPSQPVAAPAETQPLTQVLALCRQAMRRSDGFR